jgi:type I restriction enzyme M protein
VIGVAPNLFYGTGIPACILVLRQQVQNGAHRVSGKPAERQGKVLFINADREFFEGRAQNHLLPEHIEKIVTTFDEFRAIPGFSAIVDNATLKDNGYNLNIRRYADNAPPPEPHDVRAHLVGGVPKAEVADKAALFQAHGLTRSICSSSAMPEVLRLQARSGRRQDLKPAIEGNAGLVAKEAAIRAAFEQWWQAHSCASRRWPGRWTTPPASSPCATTCWPASAPRWRPSACSTRFRCAASSPASGTRPSTTSSP